MRSTISNGDALRSKILKLPGVVEAAQRLLGFALVSSGTRTYGAQIAGVEPVREPSVSTLPGVIRSGRYFQDLAAYEAIVGKTLAKNLKIGIGDELTLLGQGARGGMAAAVVTVVGIVDSGSAELDRGLVQLPFQTFQEIFSIPSQAHSIVLSLDSIEAVDRVEAALEDLLIQEGLSEELTALTWSELMPGLEQAIELDMAGGWLFFLSLIFVVSLCILNTFLMSVLERTKEFGVMLSLGATPGSLGRLIVVESQLITGLGVLIGVFIGGSIIAYFGVYGFLVPGTEELMQHWNVPTAVYTKLSLGCLTIGPLVLICTSLLASVYPVFKVRALEPVEALRAI